MKAINHGEYEDEGLGGSRWDAKTAYDLGVMMRRYIAENPPPDDAQNVEAWCEWSERLIDKGRRQLAALGMAGLEVVA